MRNAACSLLLFSVAATCDADVLWRHMPQHAFSAHDKPVFADLDRDGTREIVQITDGWRYDTKQSGIGVLRHDGLDFAQVDLTSIGDGHGGIVAVHRQGGGDRILVGVDPGRETGAMVELAGLPLRVVRKIAAGPMIPNFVADVDGDGALEIVARSHGISSQLIVLDYESGGRQWSVPTLLPTRAVAGQLDGDAALEIIASGAPGRVYDGATGLIEWSHSGGFDGDVVVGQFDTDPLVPTFANVADYRLRVYRSMPYSSLREVNVPWHTPPSTAIDVDSDGAEEIVAFGGTGSGFNIINPRTGVHEEITPGWWDSSLPGIGRIRPEGSVLAAHSGRAMYDSVVQTHVFDLVRGIAEYGAPVDIGPFRASGFANLGDSGDAAAVILSGEQTSGSTVGAIVTTWRPATATLRNRSIADTAWPQGYDPKLQTADLDGVQGDEILALLPQNGHATLVALDGIALTVRWRLDEFGAGSGYIPTDLRAADFDGDGSSDVVLLEQSGLSIRVAVVSGQDGALIWRSADLDENGFLDSGALTLHNVDADPLDEAIVASGRTVFAFDATTREIQWSFDTDPGLGGIIHLAAWGEGEMCRIAAAHEHGIISIHRCDNQAKLNSLEGVPGATMMVAVGGDRLALTAEGRLWTLGPGESVWAHPAHLGLGAGGSAGAALHISPAGELHMLVGSDVHVSRIRLRPPEIFADGFELP
jgi:hypothetical protein